MNELAAESLRSFTRKDYKVVSTLEHAELDREVEELNKLFKEHVKVSRKIRHRKGTISDIFPTKLEVWDEEIIVNTTAYVITTGGKLAWVYSDHTAKQYARVNESVSLVPEDDAGLAEDIDDLIVKIRLLAAFYS